MTKNTLLEALKDFTMVATQNIVLPTVKQKDTVETFRPADVYLMRLPDGSSAKKKVPYIIHQFVNGKDKQPSGKLPESSALVRSIFCVYSADEHDKQNCYRQHSGYDKLFLQLFYHQSASPIFARV